MLKKIGTGLTFLGALSMIALALHHDLFSKPMIVSVVIFSLGLFLGPMNGERPE